MTNLATWQARYAELEARWDSTELGAEELDALDIELFDLANRIENELEKD